MGFITLGSIPVGGGTLENGKKEQQGVFFFLGNCERRNSRGRNQFVTFVTYFTFNSTVVPQND